MFLRIWLNLTCSWEVSVGAGGVVPSPSIAVDADAGGGT